MRARRKRLFGSIGLHTGHAADDALQKTAGDLGVIAPLILIQFVDEATSNARLSVLAEEKRVVRHGFDIRFFRLHQTKDALYPFRLTGGAEAERKHIRTSFGKRIVVQAIGIIVAARRIPPEGVVELGVGFGLPTDSFGLSFFII